MHSLTGAGEGTVQGRRRCATRCIRRRPPTGSPASTPVRRTACSARA